MEPDKTIIDLKIRQANAEIRMLIDQDSGKAFIELFDCDDLTTYEMEDWQLESCKKFLIRAAAMVYHYVPILKRREAQKE